jgi:hypothetical protein
MQAIITTSTAAIQDPWTWRARDGLCYVSHPTCDLPCTLTTPADPHVHNEWYFCTKACTLQFRVVLVACAQPSLLSTSVLFNTIGAAGAQKAGATPKGPFRRLRGKFLVCHACIRQVEASVPATRPGARMHSTDTHSAHALMHAPDSEAFTTWAAVLHA